MAGGFVGRGLNVAGLRGVCAVWSRRVLGKGVSRVMLGTVGAVLWLAMMDVLLLELERVTVLFRCRRGCVDMF